MTIPGSALQLLPAQDLTQFDTGGGRVTSTPLVDNTVGALLAQVPRTARAGGQADLVKVALGIATANTDQLAGSGLFLTSGATDSHVSTVLFSTGASALMPRASHDTYWSTMVSPTTSTLASSSFIAFL